MISEKCIRGMLGRATGGLCSVDYDMSALSVRGAHHSMGLEARALRLRGVLTGVDGVRRNLFGCTDSDENRRFLERELEHQLEIDSQRWGFDFAKEQPLPGRQRFTWDLVPASSVPAALRTPASTPPAPPHTRSPEPPKTQKRITDFLKPRKRLSGGSSKKSPSAEGGAPKRARVGRAGATRAHTATS